jgi:hypothetical protein
MMEFSARHNIGPKQAKPTAVGEARAGEKTKSHGFPAVSEGQHASSRPQAQRDFE